MLQVASVIDRLPASQGNGVQYAAVQAPVGGS